MCENAPLIPSSGPPMAFVHSCHNPMGQLHFPGTFQRDVRCCLQLCYRVAGWLWLVRAAQCFLNRCRLLIWSLHSCLSSCMLWIPACYITMGQLHLQATLFRIRFLRCTRNIPSSSTSNELHMRRPRSAAVNPCHTLNEKPNVTSEMKSTLPHWAKEALSRNLRNFCVWKILLKSLEVRKWATSLWPLIQQEKYEDYPERTTSTESSQSFFAGYRLLSIKRL